MARKPHLAYYTNSTFILYPSAFNLDKFWNEIKDSDPDYLYVSTKEWHNKSIGDFLENLKKRPVELIYSNKEYECAIYRVKK